MVREMHQLSQTAQPKELTLKDWLVLAEAVGNKPMWGYYEWIDIADRDDVKSLSLQDWEVIAEELERDEKWAYYRYKEFSA